MAIHNNIINNQIKWDKYVDHIFCISYLPGNKIETISKKLLDIGINIYDNKCFSFMYDNEYKMFSNEFHNIQLRTHMFYLKNCFWLGNINNGIDDESYMIYIGIITYRILKIAQYFKYKRIAILEDDVVFLKDINYFIKALDFTLTQNFDMCMCQTTFCTFSHDKNNLLLCGCEDVGNDMFLKISKPLGVYGGAFIILTDKGINKIIKFFENNDIVLWLDSLDNFRHILPLNTLFTLKPLAVQDDFKNLTQNDIIKHNSNIKIEEYF